MDISENNVTGRQCYKCNHTLLDNLNIAYNPNNLILWNKYQIFVYEKLNFNEVIKSIIPDFQISFLIVSNNYLACLDTTGKIHLEALKFKNTTPKLLKTIPKREQDDNLCFTHYDNKHILCLIRLNSGELKLCLHQFDAEFKLVKQISILFDTDDISLLQMKRNYIIFKSFVLCENKRRLTNIFNITEDVQGNFCLLIICFDRRTVHFCGFSVNIKHVETPLKILYSCPSEISNIEIINDDDIYVLIGLKTGTLVKLSLTDMARKAHIVHLNIAISNLLVLNNILLYTDGLTMWKSENTFFDDIKLTKSFITQVKDFMKINNHIICTTFNKLIYIFEIDDKANFINSNSEEYCSANIVLNNSHYLQRIIDEIQLNNELVKKINEEENYILTLSISNRQDIMDKIINTNIIVYENYEDAIKESASVTLIERIDEYFKENMLYMLIKICINSTDQIFQQILFNNIRVHITFMSDHKVIKTINTIIVGQLKNTNYLIPLKTKSFRIKVFIIMATKIPGAYDKKQSVWNILYRKEIILNTEHFIKIEVANKNVVFMKSKESLKDLIINTVVNQYGNIFQLTEMKKNVYVKNNFAFYVKLPDNYKHILKTDNYCKKVFNLKKSEFLLQQYGSVEFLNSKNDLLLLIGDDKVNVEVINDGISRPVLKVFSRNVSVAYDIRNFFANILYNAMESCSEIGEEYVKHTFYTVVENNQKAIKDCIEALNTDELEKQIIHFERNIIGNLPI